MSAQKTRIQIILEAVDRATGPINERLKATETRMAQFRQSTDRITSALTGFGTAATASGVAVLGMLGMAAKKAADMETLSVALTTAFQGNEAAAKSAFAQIQEFAARTPYQMEEVMRSFIKLKNMGLDPSQAALESYGNTASAMSKSLNDMIEAVADAATGEFERLKEFGIKAKTQGDQVTFTFRGVSTTVQKNAEQIERYLMKIGQTEFAGGMERQSKTINGQLSTLRDNLDMTAATIGKVFLPAVSEAVAKLTPLIERVGQFAEQNPTLVKMVATFTAITVAVGALTVAVVALNLAFTANPVVLIVLGIIAAISGLITALIYFKEIAKAVYDGLTWLGDKIMTIAALAFYIAANWQMATIMFGAIFDKIAGYFSGFIDYVMAIPGKMYEAGVNIVKSIGDGIESAWSGFIKKWEERIQQIRNYLPFSPAKVGPLRDINKIQLVETIAQNITPQPIQQAMSRAMAPAMPSPMAAGGGVTITYAPSITINGAGPAAESSFATMLQQHKQELMRILSEQQQYKNRVSYA